MQSQLMRTLHVGTNDFKENKSAEKIADEISSLISSLKEENKEVAFSGICPRGDQLRTKALEVNKVLEKRCRIGFIKRDNMDATSHTNGSNLHLNREGNSILAKSFLRKIRI